MAKVESIVLDPPAVAGARIPFDLTVFMRDTGPSWGDAAISAYMADGVIGSQPVDYTIPNRTVMLPLNIYSSVDGATSFAALRTALQRAAGLWQSQGGWLARTVNGRTLYLDVVNARLTMGGSTAAALMHADVDAQLELETLPDWYGDEIADTTDDFSSLGSAWAFDAGVGTVSSSGGVLVASTTAIKRLYRTDVSWYDAQSTVQITTGGALVAFEAGVILKRVDANNYVRVTISYNGTTALILPTYVVAGRATAGSSTTIRLAPGTSYFIRGRMQGNAISVEQFSSTPALGSTPAAQAVVTTLAGANATALGMGVSGAPGVYWDASGGAAGITLDNWSVEPNVYVERSVGELVTAPIQAVAGNFPRGNRCRVVLAEAQGANQRGVVAAFRSRYYDSSAASALTFEAEALTPLDLASSVAVAGASGGSVISYSNVPTDWTPILQLTLSGNNYLTHVGGYRLLARVRSDAPAGGMQYRVLYDVGDLVAPTTNDSWSLPNGDAGFYYADLGELRLDRSPVGNHRWIGQVQVKGVGTATHLAQVDRLVLVPLDEWEAMATALLGNGNSISTIPARDSFSQSRGLNVSRLTADVGGLWSGAGDTDDFTTTGTTIKRVAVSDASALLGRYISLGSAITDQAVTAQMTYGDPTVALVSGDRYGVLARFVDANNWLFFGWTGSGGGGQEVVKCVGGVVTQLGFNVNTNASAYANLGWTLQLSVDADGNWQAGNWVNPNAFIPPLSGQDSVLASGGTLASGKPGILDCHPGAGVVTRTYDSFKTVAAQSDAALYSRMLAELRTDGLYRQDVSGSAYAKISQPLGQLPRIPCSGASFQPVEGLVIASRGDFGTLPDSAIDDLAIQVLWRPCYLFTPDT